MSLLHLHHRILPVLSQFQLSLPVDNKETSQNLCHIKQHVPAGLNIIFSINRKRHPAIRHGINLRPLMCKLNPAHFTTQSNKIINSPHRLKPVEAPVKPQHKIICFQFQTLCQTVCFTDFKDPHRHIFHRTIRQHQMKHKRHLSILQRVPVNITQKSNPHLRRIHCPQFNFRTPAALPGNISGTLHNFLSSELIRHSAFGNDRTRPEIFSCIAFHCPQKPIRHRIHPTTSVSSTKKAPASSVTDAFPLIYLLSDLF